MSNIQTIHQYRCDLSRGPCEVTLKTALMHQDALGDVFRVAVWRGGVPVDLSGLTVCGYLYFASTRQTLALEGSVTDGLACVALTADCYAVPGYASLVIQLLDGDVRHTVLKADALIKRTGSKDLYFPQDSVSLADLLARIEEMETSVESLNAAAAGFPRDQFTIAQIERVAGEVTNIEYWFLVNARWDAETERFKRIDIAKNSFGIQMQAAGTYPGEEVLGYLDNQSIGYWRAIGRDYFVSVGDTANAEAVTEDIGVMIDGEWRAFGVYLGWNNCFMLDSYGGMTIGGAGFEIDGNGLYPYSRVSLSRHEDTPGADGYAFLGLLWNAYHQLADSDDRQQADYAFGLKAPLDYMHTGTYNAASSFVDMDNASFVVMRRPAGAAHDAQTFKPVYEFTMDGKLHVDTSTDIVVDADILDSTSAQLLYPDSLNQDNLEIVRAYAETDGGNVEVTVSNVSKTEYGVLFSYAAETEVTGLKVVCTNAGQKRTIDLLSL